MAQNSSITQGEDYRTVYILLAVLTGGLISVMIKANGVLQASTGAVAALLIIHLSGLTAAAAYTLTGALRSGRRSAHKSPASAPGATRAPWWFLGAGTLGVVVVFAGNAVYSRGGVVLTLMGTLAGQAGAAWILEKSRWFDGRKSPATQRLLSLLLILPGTALFGAASGVGALWIALSWLPGIFLMVQSMMNSRNVLRFGQPVMLLSNYASALVIIACLLLLHPEILRGAAARAAQLPVYLLLGGGVLGVMVIALSSFLFNRAAALQVVLGIYAGQLGVGILIDVVSGRPLSAATVAAVAMVMTGLGAGELRRRQPMIPTDVLTAGTSEERE